MEFTGWPCSSGVLEVTGWPCSPGLLDRIHRIAHVLLGSEMEFIGWLCSHEVIDGIHWLSLQCGYYDLYHGVPELACYSTE